MDYYATLGITKDADAKAIKKAYKRLASKHHPDKEGGNEAQFKLVNQAYEVLGDPQNKQDYDAPRGRDRPMFDDAFFKNSFTNSNFEDIFNRKREQPMYRTTILVSLTQSYTGDTQSMQVETPHSGKKVVTVNIPRGVETGQQIKYPNLIQEGTALVIDFHVGEDPRYQRFGNNLLSKHDVSVLDLIVGTKFKFDTISGKTLEITIKPYTRPNTQIKIAGHGMPIRTLASPMSDSGQFGDQLILLNPVIPDTIELEIVDVIKKYKHLNDLINTK